MFWGLAGSVLADASHTHVLEGRTGLRVRILPCEFCIPILWYEKYEVEILKDYEICEDGFGELVFGCAEADFSKIK